MRTFLPLALAAAVWLSAADTNRPNFTGTWKMNAAKSSFGQLPRPIEYERHIDHQEPLIQMTVRQVGPTGEQSVDAVLRTDGRPTTNKYRGGEAKTTAEWAARELELTTTRAMEGGDAVTRETWSLSEDGKTLTSITHIKTPRGVFDVKLVLEKTRARPI
jgi:hypothetical protein